MYSGKLRKLAIYHRHLQKSYGKIVIILNMTRDQCINLIRYKRKASKAKRGPKFMLNKNDKF